MRKTTTAFLFCLLFAAGAARANHLADTYVIPVAGHAQGANGLVWMSDLVIRNTSTSELTVELIFIETGEQTFDNIQPLMGDNVDGSVTLQGNDTLLLADVLEGYRDRTSSLGAIILGGNRPFAVTSRAYNSQSPVGETIPATRDFLENSIEQADNTGFAYIPGVGQNATWRTNFGFVAGAAGSASANMHVEVTVRAAAGGVLGTHTFVIPAGSFAHQQVNLRSIAPGNFDVGSIDVRVAEGEGSVVPYASLIDNNSGEAAYIMGVLPDTTPSSTLRFAPTNVFRSLVDRYKTPTY
jgi:hypothetical protein